MTDGSCAKTSGAKSHALAMPLLVGGVRLPNRVFLAPMSGVSDVLFRRLAERAGAGMVVSEMVASAEFCGSEKESALRASGAGLRHHVVQLAGREAYWIAEAAKRAEALGAVMIDINMGCPAKKVTGGYSGSALMRDLDHALSLIEATVNAVKVPVTLKMRLGWDTQSINAPELARRAEGAGVQMITVHGRTRCQFYDGRADWSAVHAVREAVTVPLVVNGDIGSIDEARLAMEMSGADAVMVGRASYGRPWLPGEIARSSGAGLGFLQADLSDLGDYVIRHYEGMLSLYGMQTGLRHARKHLGWYIDRHAPSAPHDLRQQAMTAVEPLIVIKCLREVFLQYGMVAGNLEALAA
jgi:nifR3 family TIM-barrel protein